MRPALQTKLTTLELTGERILLPRALACFAAKNQATLDGGAKYHLQASVLTGAYRVAEVAEILKNLDAAYTAHAENYSCLGERALALVQRLEAARERWCCVVRAYAQSGHFKMHRIKHDVFYHACLQHLDELDDIIQHEKARLAKVCPKDKRPMQVLGSTAKTLATKANAPLPTCSIGTAPLACANEM